MKWLALAVALGLSGCSMTHRLGTKRCPVPLTAVLGDVAVGALAIGVGYIKSQNEKFAQSAAYSLGGGFLIGGAYASESACTRKVKR